jgi:hypothetical protein
VRLGQIGRGELTDLFRSYPSIVHELLEDGVGDDADLTGHSVIALYNIYEAYSE